MGRHVKKHALTARLTGIMLAGAFAGTMGLATGDPGEAPDGRPVAASADRGGEPAQTRAERPDGPSELPEDCDPSENDLDYPNGRIPRNKLCPLPGDGGRLRADAAAALYKLNAAYYERFGEEMCVRSAYRGFKKQKRLYRTMPSGMAARPGNSKHGSGVAADFCGGVEDDDTRQFKWLEKHSDEYGWIHPDWAYSNPYEPWHWEYRG